MKHNGPISGVAAHAGTYIATAGYDNDVILWDRATGLPIARGRHDHLVNHCGFAPDGTALVTSSSDYSARLWSLPDMRLQALLTGHDDDVEMAAFSHDGSMVATCSRDRCVRVFTRDGALLRRLDGHRADVLSVAWSADDRQLVTSGDDGTIRRWDVAGARQVDVLELAGVETDTIVVTPRGDVVAGNDDGRILFFDGGLRWEEQAHRAGIKRLVLSARGDRLVSLGYDRRMIVWALAPDGAERIAETVIPAEIWARSADFVDDTTLALATFGARYALYDLTGGGWSLGGVTATRAINAVLGVDDDILTIGDAGMLRVNGAERRALGSLCNFLCRFGSMVLTGGQLGILFDAMTGEVLLRHHAPLNCAAVFQRGGVPHAVVGAYTGEGLVLRLTAEGYAEHVATIRLHDNAVKGVAADVETIFSVCATGEAAWHRIADLSEQTRLPHAHTRIANGCVALGAGSFASVGRDLRLRLWHGAMGEEIETPHRNSIKCLALSRNGRFLATGSYIGMIAVYDLLERRWCSVTRPSAAGISSLTQGREADAFLASSYDGEVHALRIGPAEAPRASADPREVDAPVREAAPLA